MTISLIDYFIQKIQIMITRLLLSFVISISISYNLQSQTINSDWRYMLGEELVEYRFIDIPFTFTLGGGVDVTWDFSAFDQSIQVVDTLKYVLPEGLENADKFPEANMARISISSPLGSSNIAYYEVTEEKIDYIGISLNENAYGRQEPIYRVANFPMDPAESITQPFVQMYYENDVLNNEYAYLAEIKYDGFGTVITPLGTYEDCAMIRVTLNNLDGSLWREIISFHKDSYVNKIAHITNYGGEERSIFRYQDAYTSKTDESVQQETGTSVQIIGNNIEITTLREGNYKAVIFTMDGKIISDMVHHLNQGKNLIEHNLKSGLAYGFLLVEERTGKFESHRVVVR